MIRMSDAADSADPSKACEIMIGVFSPYKERLNSYMKYDISKLEDNFRAIQIIKSRYGQSDLIIPCNFFGDVNYWHDLPKADEITDYTKYSSPDYIFNDTDENQEETNNSLDNFTQTFNFD